VGVAGRVGKVVDAILLVEPRCLKEAAVVVVREDRFARFRREDLEFPDRLGEGGVVVGEPSDAGAEGGDAGAGGLVWAVLGGVKVVPGGCIVALELAAPDPAEIDVDGSVVVYERGGVDGEGFGNVGGLGSEGAFGLGRGGEAESEDAWNQLILFSKLTNSPSWSLAGKQR
jgi:hypothetical protein